MEKREGNNFTEENFPEVILILFYYSYKIALVFPYWVRPFIIKIGTKIKCGKCK